MEQGVIGAGGIAGEADPFGGLVEGEGEARSNDPLPEAPSSASLMSVGAGLRYEIAPNLSVRFDYGRALDQVPGQDSGRGHIGVMLAF